MHLSPIWKIPSPEYAIFERQEGAFQRWPLLQARMEPCSRAHGLVTHLCSGTRSKAVDVPLGFDVRALIFQSFSL